MDLQNILMGMGGGMPGMNVGQPESNVPDTAESIQISSLALIKMLKVLHTIIMLLL